MNNKSNGPLSRFVQAAAKVEPNELRAVVLSFLFVFTLMAAYFIVRPLRDAMASDWSRTETSFLWTLTFFVSVIGVMVYGFVISRVRFSRVVPGVYLFFATTFALFYAGSSFVPDPTLVDKTFYVWLSVFSLFHVSVFWSFMSGLYNREQAKRLFAVIATGASTGAIVGPVIPAFFADSIGVMNLLLITAGLQLVPVALIPRLEKLKVIALGNAGREADLSEAKRLARNPFSGFVSFIRNPYLLAIGIFIVMYVTMSTFVYMELREFLAPFERVERTEINARIDLAVNALAIVTALVVTGRIASRFGVATLLPLIPIMMVGGWLIVAAVPLLAVMIGLQIARRAGNYAVTKPGREMLFTIVSEDERYKAKPVIDICVYRGGDMVTAWFHTGLKEVLLLGTSGVAIVAAVIAGIWAIAGYYLGRTYDRGTNQKQPDAIEKPAPQES
ncbi:MAG: MFS transporter [Gammaproteobacteria bacterium]|nr:MFS transporter [Gammaproteobacteria bacterium]